MDTLVVGEHAELSEWLQRRRALGQDSRDEVWEGVYHVAPVEQPHNAIVAAEILRLLAPAARQVGLRTLTPFNLGPDQGNYRCPDGGWIAQDAPLSLYLPTAVAVLEVLSPGDETYSKFAHYAAADVREILVAHPTERWVKCYRRTALDWDERDASALFQVSMPDLQASIAWP